ncbi:hypothetical protein HH297_16415, partial [Xanthomonas sp. Kuri4-3]
HAAADHRLAAHQLVAYNTPLAQLVDELARYRHGVVHVRGERCARCRYPGPSTSPTPRRGCRCCWTACS